MSEMVERVARQITIEEGLNPDSVMSLASQPRRLRWEFYIPHARAAIAAMRKPSPQVFALIARFLIDAPKDVKAGVLGPDIIAGLWSNIVDELLK